MTKVLKICSAAHGTDVRGRTSWMVALVLVFFLTSGESGIDRVYSLKTSGFCYYTGGGEGEGRVSKHREVGLVTLLYDS